MNTIALLLVSFTLLLFYTIAPTFVSDFRIVQELFQTDVHSKHPLIYILDLPGKFNNEVFENSLSIGMVFRTHQDLQPQGPFGFLGFGKRAKGDPEWLLDTTHWELDKMFHERLLVSSHLTSDPLKADFIFLPVYLGLSEAIEIYDYAHHMDYEDLFPSIEGNESKFGINKKFLPPQLLNAESIPPFLMISGKEHGGLVDFPKGANRLLSRPVSKRTVYFTQQLEVFIQKDKSALVLPVPFQTSVHLPRAQSEPEMPWNANGRRPNLMAFYGTLHMSDERKRLVKAMKNCTDCIRGFATRIRKPNVSEIHDLYANSTFCPHLAGDRWSRKAFLDSIMAGCIPVLFWGKSKRELGNCGNYAFWSFADEIDYFSMTISLPLKEALEDGNVVQMLRNISTIEILERQRNIARNARKLQYSIFNDESDAFQMSMRMLGKFTQRSRCKSYNTTFPIPHCTPRNLNTPRPSKYMPRGKIAFFDNWFGKVSSLQGFMGS